MPPIGRSESPVPMGQLTDMQAEPTIRVRNPVTGPGKILAALGALLVLALAPWLLLAGYLRVFGIAGTGEVIDRHEAVSIRGDHWHRDLIVSYRYRLSGSGQSATASQRVDPALYDRLRVGSPVKVLYSPWKPLREFGSAGATLAEVPWYAVLPRESNDTLWFLEMEMYAVVAVLGYLAYRRRSRTLTLLAVTVGASVAAGVLLFGFLIFPILLLLWWRRPGQGFGWVLLVSMAGSAAILASRVPWPPRMPPEANLRATAVVREVHDVDRVWGTRRFPGQSVRQPFQILDLEFTPAGAADSVHAVDVIDRGSVRSLARGSTIAVLYPEGQPHSARMEGGTRDYARDLFIYVLALTYGTGAVLLLIGLPLMRLFGKVSGSLIPDPEQLEARLAGLSADDPRRQLLEERLRALRAAGARRSAGPPGS